MSEVIDLKQESEVQTTGQTYIDLIQGLYSVQDLPGKTFAEKVLVNIKKLEEALKPLNEAFEPSKEFAEFAERVQMEAKGNPEKMAAMEAENPELVKVRYEQLEKGKKLLAEKMEVKLLKIPSNSLPAGINARQLRAIESLLY